MKKYIFTLKKFGSVALLCSIVLAMSCTDDYDDINTNKNKISVLAALSDTLSFFKGPIHSNE